MSFSFKTCKIKAKYSREFLKNTQCLKRASALSKGEVPQVKCGHSEQSSAAMNKDSPPRPFPAATEAPRLDPPWDVPAPGLCPDAPR